MEKERSKRFTRFKKLYHYIFGEKFYKKLDFKWNQYPNRYQVIQDTINRKSYKIYLEIGCFQNELFSKIKIDTKIGVDPVSGGTIRDTSDNFFKKNNIKFDIIFIDGLHEYDQVKKDINNSLLFLNNNGVIFLHDCMPKSYLHQAVPRATGVWNGDVWKNIVELRTKPEIDTYVVCADQGIGMILKRPNKQLLKLNITNFKKLKFRDFFYNYKKYLNIVYHQDLINIF
jgi:predicted O-methyltransferase YrrM